MRQKIELTEGDIKLARYIAERRNVNEGHYGPMTYVGNGSLEIHFLGAIGEIGFAKCYGLDPDLEFSERGGGRLYDQIVGNKNLEIKSTYYPSPRLMVNKKAMKDADIYVLMVVDRNHRYTEILGYATRDEVLKAPLTGASPAYTIPEHNLKALPQLTGSVAQR